MSSQEPQISYSDSILKDLNLNLVKQVYLQKLAVAQWVKIFLQLLCLQESENEFPQNNEIKYTFSYPISFRSKLILSLHLLLRLNRFFFQSVCDYSYITLYHRSTYVQPIPSLFVGVCNIETTNANFRNFLVQFSFYPRLIYFLRFNQSP
jgi:hypothetical protein